MTKTGTREMDNDKRTEQGKIKKEKLSFGEYELVKHSKIYEGKVFNVVVDDIRYPSGNHSIREIVEHPGGAVIVPVLPSGKILLVEQFRYPVGSRLLELPAGKLDPNEDPQTCARRELVEETGYEANKLLELSTIYTTPGYSNERLWIFLAEDVTPHSGGRRPEEGEQTMTLHPVSLAEAAEMIVRKEIIDGKTVTGIFLATEHLRRKNR